MTSAFDWFTHYLAISGSVAVGQMWQCPAHSDSYPSLSVTEGGDGKVLIHCFAGWETDDILAELGLPGWLLFRAHPWPPDQYLQFTGASPSFSDFEWRQSFGSSRHEWREGRSNKYATDIHQYTDDHRLVRDRYYIGNKVCRWQTRRFNQWEASKGLDLDELPLYRCEELRQAIEEGKQVVLCESESSVDSLWEAGLPATTWAGGASSPNVDKLRAELAHARVLFIPDNDPAGLRCLSRLERDLAPHVAQWTVLLGQRGEDARDLLSRGELQAAQ